MKTEFQQQIIMRLKVLREMHGLTQSQVAFFLGISPGQLGNIDSNKQKHKYTLKQIFQLCKKYGVSITKIFCENDDSDIDQLINNIIRYEENE